MFVFPPWIKVLLFGNFIITFAIVFIPLIPSLKTTDVLGFANGVQHLSYIFDKARQNIFKHFVKKNFTKIMEFENICIMRSTYDNFYFLEILLTLLHILIKGLVRSTSIRLNVYWAWKYWKIIGFDKSRRHSSCYKCYSVAGLQNELIWNKKALQKQALIFYIVIQEYCRFFSFLKFCLSSHEMNWIHIHLDFLI